MRHARKRIVAALGPSLGLAAFACVPLACDGGSQPAPPPPTSRVEAVTAQVNTTDSLKDFCDVRAAPGQGKAFHFPPVEGGAPTAPAQDSFLWVNLWATWCKPCVEEMPRIAGWQKQFAAQGKRVDLKFVSIDEDAQAVSAFRSAHPNMPETLKLQSSAALAPFISEIGLDSGAGLPIHVFVEKGGHVRCVRAGGVLDSHYATIASMVR